MSVLIRLNSSQGKRERVRRDTGLLSRMLKITGNSSIQFFDIKIVLGTVLFFISPLSRAQYTPSEDSLRFVGDGYEAIMLQLLYDQMKKSHDLFQGDEDSPFAPSGAEKIFQSMKDQSLVQNMAKHRPLGVSDMVVKSLKGDGGVSRRNLVK